MVVGYVDTVGAAAACGGRGKSDAGTRRRFLAGVEAGPALVAMHASRRRRRDEEDMVSTQRGTERSRRHGRALRALTRATLAGLVAVALLPAAEAGAVTLNPGDILVSDVDFLGESDAVIRVDPATGAQTTVSTGGSFVDPFGVALEADGDILVADADAFGGLGGVIRVDPATGAQTTVSTGGSFVDPAGIAVEAD